MWVCVCVCVRACARARLWLLARRFVLDFAYTGAMFDHKFVTRVWVGAGVCVCECVRVCVCVGACV